MWSNRAWYSTPGVPLKVQEPTGCGGQTRMVAIGIAFPASRVQGPA